MIYALLLGGLAGFLLLCFMTGGRCLGRYIYRKIWGGTLVILEDSGGRLYKTLAKKTPSGKLSAPVYFFTDVGRVVLEEDGTIQSHYCKMWTKG